MIRVAAATFSRAEYSSFRPLLAALGSDPAFNLQLLVSGTHLAPAFGHTVDEIVADGHPISERIEMPLASDTPEAEVQALGLGAAGFARAFARLQPDVLLLVGDRLELLTTAMAALAFRIPVAHVSGGDVTEGAIDNQVRFAVSRLSHLHFVSMEEHAARLIRMGEDPARVEVTGDPALDQLAVFPRCTREQLAASLGVPLTRPLLVVTHHPATLGGDSAAEAEALLAALAEVESTIIFTGTNSDVGGRAIVERVEAFVRSRPTARLVKSLGQDRFYNLLAQADAMVGNSSSGIWEAPSFRLPVVNIGERQRGRRRAGNVIEAQVSPSAILAAVRQALSPGFRASLAGLSNPYGDGRAAERIVAALKRTEFGPALLQKRYYPTEPM